MAKAQVAEESAAREARVAVEQPGATGAANSLKLVFY